MHSDKVQEYAMIPFYIKSLNESVFAVISLVFCIFMCFLVFRFIEKAYVFRAHEPGREFWLVAALIPGAFGVIIGSRVIYYLTNLQYFIGLFSPDYLAAYEIMEKIIK